MHFVQYFLLPTNVVMQATPFPPIPPTLKEGVACEDYQKNFLDPPLELNIQYETIDIGTVLGTNTNHIFLSLHSTLKYMYDIET